MMCNLYSHNHWASSICPLQWLYLMVLFLSPSCSNVCTFSVQCRGYITKWMIISPKLLQSPNRAPSSYPVPSRVCFPEWPDGSFLTIKSIQVAYPQNSPKAPYSFRAKGQVLPLAAGSYMTWLSSSLSSHFFLGHMTSLLLEHARPAPTARIYTARSVSAPQPPFILSRTTSFFFIASLTTQQTVHVLTS